MSQSVLFRRRPLVCAAMVALGSSMALAEDATPKPEKTDDAKPTLVPPRLFTVPEGLEVTVWATSPQLFNPTNMDVDRAGRIWVCEGVNYRGKSNRRTDGDRIIVLEDTDGDGVADASHVFVQEPFLNAPLGIAVFDNKIVVSQAPSLIVYTDVNRNGVFDPGTDTREVLLTGFNGHNHDHSLHSVTAGPDGLWYWNAGNCGAQFTDKSGKTFRMGSPYDPFPGKKDINELFAPPEIAGQKSDDGHVYIGGFTARMNPDGSNVAVIGHNYRNSYEQSITSLGDVFQNDNDDPPACRVSQVLEYGNAGYASRDGKRTWSADKRPGQTTQVAEWRQEDPGSMPAGDVYGGGSPTGTAFYENGALGDRWIGTLLSGEPGRNVVFGYQPKAVGAGFRLERLDWLTTNAEHKYNGSDFTGGKWDGQLTSLFRPSDMVVGADGAVYVADWFDGRVGGHQTLDDSLSGTIYRIAPKGFKPAVPKFDERTIPGLITALRSPAVNVRFIGFTGLKAQSEEAVPAVAALLVDSNPYLAARATWLLAQMGPTGVAQVRPLLKAADETKRLVAYRALRRAGIEVLALAAGMADDASPAVRREVAITLRDVPAADSLAILAQVAQAFDGKDRSYLDAVGIGAFTKESALYAALAKDAGSPETWSEATAWLAWRLGAPAAVPALKTRALASTVPAPLRKLAVDGIAFIQDQAAATAMIDLAATKDFPFKAMATWWLMNRVNNEWKEFGVREALKASGLYDPEKIAIEPVAAPPKPTQPTALSATRAAALVGNPANGQARIAVCYACHHIGGQGADFGPDLTMFAKTQPKDVVIDAIINPSKDISHGFEGSTVVTEAGDVNGIIMANGDPVIIKSIGGVVQTIPKKKIKEMNKLDYSLMMTADAMGLDEQALADITAYMLTDLK